MNKIIYNNFNASSRILKGKLLRKFNKFITWIFKKAKINYCMIIDTPYNGYQDLIKAYTHIECGSTTEEINDRFNILCSFAGLMVIPRLDREVLNKFKVWQLMNFCVNLHYLKEVRFISIDESKFYYDGYHLEISIINENKTDENGVPYKTWNISLSKNTDSSSLPKLVFRIIADIPENQYRVFRNFRMYDPKNSGSSNISYMTIDPNTLLKDIPSKIGRFSDYDYEYIIFVLYYILMSLSR